MVTYYDLRQHLYSVADEVRNGRARVAGVHTYPDGKVVFVITHANEPPQQVCVLDQTKAPYEPEVQEVEEVEEMEAIATTPEQPLDDDSATCKYCGKVFSKRGLTRHENKCTGNAVE